MCKGQTVECMTVRHFNEGDTSKVEVWVGSGQSDDLSGQVTIVDLSDTGVEVNDFLICLFVCWLLHCFSIYNSRSFFDTGCVIYLNERTYRCNFSQLSPCGHLAITDSC